MIGSVRMIMKSDSILVNGYETVLPDISDGELKFQKLHYTLYGLLALSLLQTTGRMREKEEEREEKITSYNKQGGWNFSAETTRK